MKKSLCITVLSILALSLVLTGCSSPSGPGTGTFPTPTPKPTPNNPGLPDTPPVPPGFKEYIEDQIPSGPGGGSINAESAVFDLDTAETTTGPKPLGNGYIGYETSTLTPAYGTVKTGAWETGTWRTGTWQKGHHTFVLGSAKGTVTLDPGVTIPYPLTVPSVDFLDDQGNPAGTLKIEQMSGPPSITVKFTFIFPQDNVFIIGGEIRYTVSQGGGTNYSYPIPENSTDITIPIVSSSLSNIFVDIIVITGGDWTFIAAPSDPTATWHFVGTDNKVVAFEDKTQSGNSFVPPYSISPSSTAILEKDGGTTGKIFKSGAEYYAAQLGHTIVEVSPTQIFVVGAGSDKLYELNGTYYVNPGSIIPDETGTFFPDSSGPECFSTTETVVVSATDEVYLYIKDVNGVPVEVGKVKFFFTRSASTLAVTYEFSESFQAILDDFASWNFSCNGDAAGTSLVRTISPYDGSALCTINTGFNLVKN